MSEFTALCEKASLAPSLAFLGGGNLVTALIDGLLEAGLSSHHKNPSGFITKKEVAISVRSETSCRRWKDLGFEHVYMSNEKLLAAHGRGVVVLGVKPQQREKLFSELSSSAFASTPLVVSLLAGINLATLTPELRNKGLTGGILRWLPNTACAMRAGASIFSTAPETPKELSLAEKLGVVIELDEKVFNAAGAISGCGPAFVLMVIEALADGGVLGGCPRSAAHVLATHCVLVSFSLHFQVQGAARLVAETGEHPAVLRERICSPAGTTIAGVRQLEKTAIRSAFIEAVQASTDRSNNM